MSLVDDLLRLLGTNRTQVAWRWRNLKRDLARARGSIRNRSQAITYHHQVCPRCTHPASRDERVCSRCGARLHGVAMQRLRRAVGGVIPASVPVVAVLVMVACTALFLVSLRWLGELRGGDNVHIAPDGLALFRFGDADSAEILGGAWWRLVTAIFLHGNAMHLAMNCGGLLVSARALEERVGRARTWVVFVATGIAGNLTTLAWRATHSPGSSVGASGAVMGLIGAIIGLAVRRRGVRQLRDQFIRWAIFAMVMGVVIRADNFAHAGGLASGFLVGLLLADKRDERRAPTWLWWGLAIGALAVVGLAFLAMRRYQLPAEYLEWLGRSSS